MTQLIINGTEAVLPRNFSTTVKRENSFFTKSGEYTYDCTLNLDNPTNCNLYGFLHRLNKSEQIETSRPATLIADGHVYARGTEIITRWTDESVTIQIVSGASELNYFIGQDRKISELDMGEIEDEDVGVPFYDHPELKYPAIDYCLPTIAQEGSDSMINVWSYYENADTGERSLGFRASWLDRTIAQPYMCAVLRRLFRALDYQLGAFQLENTQFKYLFFVNRKNTRKYSEMFEGWTVKELLEEVEKLTNCCFLLDNQTMTVDVLLRHTFYQTASQFTIRNVVDAYETEVDNDDQNADISSADITYGLPNDGVYNMMRLPEFLKDYLEFRHYPSMDDVRRALETESPSTKMVAVNDTTGRMYIRRVDEPDEVEDVMSEINRRKWLKLQKLEEVDLFADLKRGEDGNGEVELKLIPAPMGTAVAYFTQDSTDEGQYGEVGQQHYVAYMAINAIKIPSSDAVVVKEEDEGVPSTIQEMIEDADSPSESSQINLYIAFYNGLHGPFTGNIHAEMVGVAYTDAEHAYTFGAPADQMTYEGSLRTKVIDTDTYSNGYQIDTRYPVTIETYDPNVIDPRQVYVIRNRRFVCRDVEEVITAEGRQAKWKGTFYPIHLSDEALEHRWVLTHGVWDDHAAWIDDGRWMDLYDGALV